MDSQYTSASSVRSSRSKGKKKSIVSFLGGQDPRLVKYCTVFLNSYQSAETRRNYEFDLIKYFDFLLNVRKLKVESAEDCANLYRYNLYQNYLLNKYKSKNSVGMPSTSVSRYLSCVKSFYRSLVLQRAIQYNPIGSEIRVKTGRSKPVNAFSSAEVKKCFKYLSDEYLKHKKANKKLEAKRAYRNILLFRIMYETGGRSNAIRSIRIKDIDFIEKTIEMTTKGHFLHSQKMGDVTMQLLRDYYDCYLRHKSEDSLIFVGQDKKSKIKSNTLQKFVSSTAEKAGIKKRVSPHSFRATLITHLHEQGIPSIGICDYMGIKAVGTVEKYLRNRNDLDVNRLCAVEQIVDKECNSKFA